MQLDKLNCDLNLNSRDKNRWYVCSKRRKKKQRLIDFVKYFYIVNIIVWITFAYIDCLHYFRHISNNSLFEIESIKIGLFIYCSKLQYNDTKRDFKCLINDECWAIWHKRVHSDWSSLYKMISYSSNIQFHRRHYVKRKCNVMKNEKKCETM